MKIGIISIGMIVLLIASAIPAVTADKLDPKIDPWIEIIDANDDENAKIILKNFDDEDVEVIVISLKIDREWVIYDEFVIDNSGVNGPTVITIGGSGTDIPLSPGRYPISVKCDGIVERGNIEVLSMT